MSWPDKLRIVYRDFHAQKAIGMVNCIPMSTDAQLDNLVQALNNCTNAVQAEITVERLTYPIDTESGATGPYSTRRDMMRMNFLTAGGVVVTFSLPAPKGSNFKLDGQTVDPLDADVATLITQIIARGVSSSGAALVSFRDGVRWYFNE